MGLKEGRERIKKKEKRRKEREVLVYMKNIRRQGQRKKERKKERKKGEGKAGRERKREGWTDGGSVCVCVRIFLF